MSDQFDTTREENEQGDVAQEPRKRAPKIITVYGAQKKELDRVAFFETHESHPDGEAYVVNDGQPVQVAETPAVKRAIGEGRLTTERVNWNSKINAPKRKTVQEVDKSPGLPTGTEPQGNALLRKGGRPGDK